MIAPPPATGAKEPPLLVQPGSCAVPVGAVGGTVGVRLCLEIASEQGLATFAAGGTDGKTYSCEQGGTVSIEDSSMPCQAAGKNSLEFSSSRLRWHCAVGHATERPLGTPPKERADHQRALPGGNDATARRQAARVSSDDAGHVLLDSRQGRQPGHVRIRIPGNEPDRRARIREAVGDSTTS